MMKNYTCQLLELPILKIEASVNTWPVGLLLYLMNIIGYFFYIVNR